MPSKKKTTSVLWEYACMLLLFLLLLVLLLFDNMRKHFETTRSQTIDFHLPINVILNFIFNNNKKLSSSNNYDQTIEVSIVIIN